LVDREPLTPPASVYLKKKLTGMGGMFRIRV